MKFYRDGGNTFTNQVGKLKDFEYVWVNPNVMTNILSLKEARNKFRVRYDYFPEGGVDNTS